MFSDVINDLGIKEKIRDHNLRKKEKLHILIVVNKDKEEINDNGILCI